MLKVKKKTPMQQYQKTMNVQINQWNLNKLFKKKKKKQNKTKQLMIMQN